MPFAYNSPVIVLDFEVGNKNIIKGRFKDAIRSRVFEFEIGDSITFKPFTWKRTDSLDVDPVAWEDYSKGYCYRFDVAKYGIYATLNPMLTLKFVANGSKDW
jgi:hypothetical protein